MSNQQTLPPSKTEFDGGKSKGEARIFVTGIWKIVFETVLGILPITVLLLAFNSLILKSSLANPRQTIAGLILTGVGLVIFAIGLNLGIIPLGESVGLNLPKESRIWVVLLFGFLVGYSVTLSEPSLQAMGAQIEELSAGLMRKNVFIQTVAVGVGAGVSLGLLKIILQIPMARIIVPGFIIAVILGLLAPTEIIGLAFDSGSVTTGPVTVPIMLALGIGLATALGGRDPLIDGFGLVALCAIGPVITVLLMGTILFKA
ncbi:MAG: DUF1538 domain-containing protein [Limnochordia bacterium]|jgi:hypothetical protein|nr:DUF1538 domain-containing protein [Limnochordia bacterium]MDD2628912.1 DUF1538 domain-containing protein [Limnochordia bacterium]MDD4517833.1 DUF1538 domain-containing protein [Limnochordia bacterium]